MKYNGLQVGWLAPDGDMYECDLYDHIEMAKEICKKFGYEGYKSVDDILLSHSWVHITCSLAPYRKFYIEWNKFLTEPQIQFLKPYFTNELINNAACIRWEQEVEI